MSMTSAEVDSVVFHTARKGYAKDDVDVFLDRVARGLDEYAQVVASLHERVRWLEERLGAYEFVTPMVLPEVTGQDSQGAIQPQPQPQGQLHGQPQGQPHPQPQGQPGQPQVQLRGQPQGQAEQAQGQPHGESNQRGTGYEQGAGQLQAQGQHQGQFRAQQHAAAQGQVRQEGWPPGWYPDPWMEGSERYWDGAEWTRQAR